MKRFFLLVIFLPAFCFSQKAKEDWDLKKDENGITVYARIVTNSSFKELKSIIYLKTSLQSIVALLTDWENYPKWVYKCGSSTTLKKTNDTSFVHYQTILVPWPASKRDIIANIFLSQEKESQIVTMKSICNANFIPVKEEYVRITKMNACWTLVPLNDGRVQITYQLLVDPGGSIPAWIVNMAAVDGPFQTMTNLKTWVAKKKYQEAKIDFIKESD